MERKRQLKAQSSDDQRRRDKSIKETAKELEELLRNETGLERLENITDDEWNAALAAQETPGGL